MATPSPYYIACFPLQEYFVDKDTGFPLAAGKVEFYSDPAYTVPKSVYMQSYNAGSGQYSYVNVGNIVTLSSVGTPQYLGEDFIPFLLPYEYVIDGVPGPEQLYFVKVISSGGVLQFTRQGWPPNLNPSNDVGDVFQGSMNTIANSQFTSVSFTTNPTDSLYTINVTNPNQVTPIAPGWDIITSGAGVVKVSQQPLADAIPGNPPTSIRITSDATVSAIKLRQRITSSPRLFYQEYVSSFMMAKTSAAGLIPVTMYYRPSSPGTAYIVGSGTTSAAGIWTYIINTQPAQEAVFIDTDPSNKGLDGYVDIEIEFSTNSTWEFTSIQLVSVLDASSQIPFITVSTPEETNSAYYVDKPKLEAKPIPSYTLGWDFQLNPFQEFGVGAKTYSPGNGKSTYIADQTILFQNVTGSVTASKVNGKGLNLAIGVADTSFALIQYLDTNVALDVLQSQLCSQLQGFVGTGTLNGQINLYWTTNATLPNLKSTGYYSLVSAVNDAGIPTVGGGGNYGDWTPVVKSLGTAYFQLTTSKSTFNFSGWDSSAVAGIDTATYLAVVISFAKAPVGQVIDIVHCTLQKGSIPTAPQAISFGETLSGLQQYYEKSYNLNNFAGNVTTAGATAFGQTTVTGDTIGISTSYKTSKRKAPTAATNLNIYSTNGATNNVYDTTSGNMAITSKISAENGFWFTYNATVNPSNGHTILCQWVADSRLGIEL